MNAKIVIVDDDPTNTELARMLLELEGFIVITAATLTAAYAVAAPDIDAFIIDYHLARGEKGIDLLRDIRAGKTGAPHNCISIVSSGDYRSEPDAVEAGATLFLSKPYSIEILVTHLYKLLAEGGIRD
jgi:DNA-binding response OmpR family regulator